MRVHTLARLIHNVSTGTATPTLADTVPTTTRQPGPAPPATPASPPGLHASPAGMLKAWWRGLTEREPEGPPARRRADRAATRPGPLSALRGDPGAAAGVVLPRRGYDVEVVGAALLAAADGVGHRRVAAGVDVPAGARCGPPRPGRPPPRAAASRAARPGPRRGRPAAARGAGGGGGGAAADRAPRALALRYALPGMTEPETRDYLTHHLKLAGRSDQLFSDDAAALIHQTGRGLRGWLRAVRAGAPALTACAVGVAAAAGASMFPAQVPARWAGRALPEAVAALGAAARAFALSLAMPRPPGPGGHWSGVDYLAVIAERHRRHLRAVRAGPLVLTAKLDEDEDDRLGEHASG